MRRARGFSRHIDETNEEGGMRKHRQFLIPHRLSLGGQLFSSRECLASEWTHVRPLAVARAEIRRPPLLQVGLDLIEAALAVLRVVARDVAEMVKRSDLFV